MSTFTLKHKALEKVYHLICTFYSLCTKQQTTVTVLPAVRCHNTICNTLLSTARDGQNRANCTAAATGAAEYSHSAPAEH